MYRVTWWYRELIILLFFYADLVLVNEDEIEKVEEKTNQLLTSLDMWTKTEQVGQLAVPQDPKLKLTLMIQYIGLF